jgi:glycosyltransferase involved in cell wall biosynthesis
MEKCVFLLRQVKVKPNPPSIQILVNFVPLWCNLCYLVIDLRMQEPESRPSQDPHAESELLREKLRRLEVEHAEVQQKLFDQYEWTREKTKAFDNELRSLRSISVEYHILNFLRRICQRTTGLPMKTLEEDVVRVKVSLAAIPDRSNPLRDDWLRSFLRQTHANFDLVVVLGNSDSDVSQDIADHASVRVVRVEDSYSDAIRANVGLCWTSGDVHGFVVSGYWPYERSIENVARFFAAQADCDVAVPADFSIWHGLFAATEVPGRDDFLSIWNNYKARRGSFFFRPKAYKKVGRIVYEAGDGWVFATLLQLSWHVGIGRPESLIFVNGAIETPELRAKRESVNKEARRQFYYRNLFGDYEKPTWYFPFSHSSRPVRLVRRAIDQLWLRSRGWFLQPIRSGFLSLRALISPGPRLLFPISPASLDFGDLHSIVLSGVDRCPLTERLPDRLLFSLRRTVGKPVVDVFYSSETAVAVVSRRGPDSGDCTTQKDSANPDESILGALGSAITEVLDGEDIGKALWIGDAGFAPDSGGDPIHYQEKRLWGDYPSLVSADLPALGASDILAGRITDTGFDLIHLAGVIPFCQRPRHLLRFLAFGLGYNRYLLITSPNLDSDELDRFGPAWCHWDPDRTRFMYGVRSLRALLKHCGFEEKRMITFSHPLWQSATRRNAVERPAYKVSDKSATGGTMTKPEGKGASKPTDLDGDFLVGLFARKL